MPKKLVLDLETKRSFDEVGGSENKAQMGVSIVGSYHYDIDSFKMYREDQLDELAAVLKEAEQIIGFNLIGFDWVVLAAELGDWVKDLPTLDLMLEAQKSLKHRVSLDSIAQATLGASKIGSGLDALEYYRTGDWKKLERYCLEDVKLTRDLYEYAKKNGQLYFQKGKRRAPIAMSFSEHPLAGLFNDAAASKSSVKMFYNAKERLVDVHSFDGLYVQGYCHLRKEVLTFRVDKIEEAEAVASSQSLFG